jgi:Protein of unknown function (DUF616)
MESSKLRRCVYTTMIGRYEKLSEQSVAARSSVPFICLTDDPDLRSETWNIRLAKPVFAADLVRSQRDLKIRPHVHLSDFDSSLYIDNTVQLTELPELLFERHLSETAFCLPVHSFRNSVFDEFLEVAALGLDNQDEILEQLNHYATHCPDVLRQRPYWTAVLLRDHTDELVRQMQEIWAAHVFRYSRRDQLSVNQAFQQSGLSPDVLEIDNFSSPFHNWPIVAERNHERRHYQGSVSLTPLIARIRELEGGRPTGPSGV